jgi:hypothetical protein
MSDRFSPRRRGSTAESDAVEALRRHLEEGAATLGTVGTRC